MRYFYKMLSHNSLYQDLYDAMAKPRKAQIAVAIRLVGTVVALKSFSENEVLAILLYHPYFRMHHYRTL